MGIESVEEGEWNEGRNVKEDLSVVRKGNFVGWEILIEWLGLCVWNMEIVSVSFVIIIKFVLFLVVWSLILWLCL